MADPRLTNGAPATFGGANASSNGRTRDGELREHATRTGTVTYSMRIRWRGTRLTIRLGNELEGWNRRLAELKLQETTEAIAAGIWRPPVPDLDAEERDPTFHEFATVWFDRHTADLDESTTASYGHVLSRYILPEFKDHRLTEITYETVVRWRDRLRKESEQLKLATANRVVVLDKQGNPPDTRERGERARTLRAAGLTWNEVAAELECAEATAIYLAGTRPNDEAPRRRRAMIIVLALTGARASEHTGLTWDRVDHTHGRIIVQDAKTEAGVREIHLSPFVRTEIALYRRSLERPPDLTEPVFPVRGGGPSDRFNLGRRLRLTRGLAPLPARITPHTFRRTFITLSFQTGKDLVFVQSQAGHADWKTTLDIYTQQSGRSIDPNIRTLLDAFLGESDAPLNQDESTVPDLIRRFGGVL
jgi:integrase